MKLMLTLFGFGLIGIVSYLLPGAVLHVYRSYRDSYREKRSRK